MALVSMIYWRMKPKTGNVVPGSECSRSRRQRMRSHCERRRTNDWWITWWGLQKDENGRQSWLSSPRGALMLLASVGRCGCPWMMLESSRCRCGYGWRMVGTLRT